MKWLLAFLLICFLIGLLQILVKLLASALGLIAMVFGVGIAIRKLVFGS